MKTCAVSKLEYWNKFPVEKELRTKDQENLEENSHQVLGSEEVKDYKDKVIIQKELDPRNTADFNSNAKERNVKGILTSRKANGNTCSQISQAINSYNFKNPEDIRRKTLKSFSHLLKL
ncbi:hypothetical protein O181_111954 [Austropuccinia psidii MF-1]|uniref:Uncharacterized protein n=1 Tax=Austropuccinia psidii MF-1 TaxID=1389203 RepID=A0A9Q3PSA2_9BASI|nr:hypothetical protein [Austropuccinia psidii MF-1]